MKFMIEVLKLLFSKQKRENNLNLTKEQKKKYSKQYWDVMLPNIFIFLALIYSVGDSTYTFLSTGNFLYIGLLILFLRTIENIAKNIKRDIDLIEERIERRLKKNKKIERVER